eukprot:CAMPEP_0178489426 /NCGR_PEP_ID=MMETSP0696-20121128/10370_1 /TAXON_ID=265572 /ORGANISM="Extubocellulus spinifer, Strain CCMP396" /LENGTH=391 /DNA_ID=CAMNT_0020117227 /DNA_START=60 /DNA_END=1235 /DNA_ORIENTATION=+
MSSTAGGNDAALKATVEAKDSLFVDATATSGTHESVSEYYGQTLSTSDDLKTNACCTGSSMPRHIKSAISKIHPTVIAKYYGCGLCVPDLLDGTTVLDLGCGAGRDVYIASQLVGPNGKVIGVDMTPEQLDVAKETQPYHADKFGFANTEFHLGKIEELDQIESLEDNSVDVIVSNCVINLCPDKEAVLKSCYRLLKPGGELYFSDVYSNRRVPESLRKDKVLWGECLSGALYWNDFQNLAKRCGFADPRLVEDAPITIENDDVQATIDKAGQGNLDFYSATYRLFKLDDLEPHCEDYGQAVIYKGTIPRHPSGWSLDDHHYIEAGKVFPVCGNTWNMLAQTRFSEHFDFIGNFDTHYGIFDGCGTSIPYQSATTGVSSKGGSAGGGGGCC